MKPIQEQATPPTQISPWHRAQKAAGTAFGFGSFLGIYGGLKASLQSGFSFAGRVLFTLVAALLLGLLFAAVTYWVAALFYAVKGQPKGMVDSEAKGEPKAADSATAASKKEQNTRLAWAGVIIFFAVMWIIGANHGTKPAQEVQTTAAPAAGRNYENRQPVQQSDAEAVTSYVKAAEEGDARAQAWLGWIYSHGKGVPQSYEEAAKWYFKAAVQGNATAQINLGLMYRLGQGVPQDLVKAYECFCVAAAQGDTNAVTSRDMLLRSLTPEQLAEAERRMSEATEADAKAQAAQFKKDFYEKHPDLKPHQAVVDAATSNLQASGYYQVGSREGVMAAIAAVAREDLARQQRAQPMPETNEAPHYDIEALKSSPAKGDSATQTWLGDQYRVGQGVPQNYEEAFKWYLKAARQGNAAAQNNLGVLLREGLGVQQDTVQAYAMFYMAAEGGCTYAETNRVSVGHTLSYNQISDALRRADSFLAGRSDP